MNFQSIEFAITFTSWSLGHKTRRDDRYICRYLQASTHRQRPQVGIQMVLHRGRTNSSKTHLFGKHLKNLKEFRWSAISLLRTLSWAQESNNKKTKVLNNTDLRHEAPHYSMQHKPLSTKDSGTKFGSRPRLERSGCFHKRKNPQKIVGLQLMNIPYHSVTFPWKWMI